MVRMQQAVLEQQQNKITGNKNAKQILCNGKMLLHVATEQCKQLLTHRKRFCAKNMNMDTESLNQDKRVKFFTGHNSLQFVCA